MLYVKGVLWSYVKSEKKNENIVSSTRKLKVIVRGVETDSGVFSVNCK